MDKIKVPVMLFTGFLESGKTKFIQETLEDKRFNDKERTLLIVCEEGLEEYEPEKFSGKNVFIKVIENESELTKKLLDELYRETKPERALIEYNGMWTLDTLYRELPDDWAVVQEMMFADAEKFKIYNQNMRQLTVDKLQSAEMLVFNRADENTDMEEFHKIVRGINNRTQMAYEYKDGRTEFDEIEDPLPFDLEAPIIEIGDDDYAVWYRDMSENPEHYINKSLKFKGLIGFDKMLPKNDFLVGRHIMTCCEEDIEYFPIICKGKVNSAIKNADWVTVSGKYVFEYHKVYQGKGPILKEIKVEQAEPPENPVAVFS